MAKFIEELYHDNLDPLFSKIPHNKYGGYLRTVLFLPIQSGHHKRS